MKKVGLLITLFYLAIAAIQAQINFALDYASFYSPGEKPYVEFYLSINGSSISYAEVKTDLFQANLEITYILEEGEQVASFEKFKMNSPEYSLEDLKLDLMDQKRIAIDNGAYSLTVLVKDLVSGLQAESKVPLPKINYGEESISISQIQLANSIVKSEDENAFVKNGIEIIPNISHVYGIGQNELAFYLEVYHANKSLEDNSAYLLEYKIVDEKSGEVAANLRGIKRMSANPITPISQSFTVEELNNGNYQLVVNAINQQNQIIASSSTSFFRNNPKKMDLSTINLKNTFVDSMTNIDELSEHIKSLRPISTDDELVFGQNQLNYENLEFMQRYFYNFWYVRNELDPEAAWLAYKEELAIVDREFGYGNIKGYQTERGRVYLQYGKPNSIVNVPFESETYPYCIWQYYKLQGLTDRKFVFYSPSMEMLGYEVLHSNVRGEINNPGWEVDLINKTNGGRRSNQEDPQDRNLIIHQNSRTLFDNPR